jgi:phosphomannomutase
MNEKIFKAYDIRGSYPEELTEETAYKIGRAFAIYAKVNKIIVGRDTRLSSPSLTEAVIKGITDAGVDVINIGLCSTSCFYFTVGETKDCAGIMTTASHAPKKINGFKMVFGGNLSLIKEQILELKKIVLENNFPTIANEGTAVNQDYSENYIQAVRKNIRGKINPLKIVMDPGNGTAGLYIEKVFQNIGVSIVPIFFEPDGNFPNHETNPKIPENRIKLKEKILEEKADLGFMFDGDADRMYILDRNGDVIDPSLILAIIGEYMIKNSEHKKKVVVEVRTSRIVRDWIEKIGGKVIISSCWTIPIKLEMKADPEIAFGGETSGHYIFPELHETDDGIFAALTFLQAISAKNESIDDILKKFREKYFVLEETNFELTDMGEADKILENLRNKYSAEGAEILNVDGLSVVFPDWWFNIRKSQAEPVIRLNLEAKSQKLMEEKRDELLNFIKK